LSPFKDDDLLFGNFFDSGNLPGLALSWITILKEKGKTLGRPN